jgi:hypothetical protein
VEGELKPVRRKPSHGRVVKKFMHVTPPSCQRGIAYLQAEAMKGPSWCRVKAAGSRQSDGGIIL